MSREYNSGQLPSTPGDNGGVNDYGQGRTDYDPGAVQEEINKILAEIARKSKGSITTQDSIAVTLYFLMYLMQEYGAQSTGLESNNVGRLNNYLDDMNDLSNYFYSADDPSLSGSTALDKKFLDKIAEMEKQINDPDSWFNKSEQGRSLKSSILGALNGLKKQVLGAQKPSVNHLFNLWAKFDPSLTGGTGGSTSSMNPFMSQLGQLNQQFTGASQIVAANAKTVAKTWQSEQNSFNNYGRNLYNLYKYLIQHQRVQ